MKWLALPGAVAALAAAGAASSAQPGFSAHVDDPWDAAGTVGTVLEQTVKGGNERNELISVSR
jgi:hypothetical protein